ncbi:hypothetical protein BDY21DRAFT_134317 [Lineolata rhizophorae]|uniref:Zn(2)-C6 fungal-type domain-containing protein n=1 Tax=Lineolata rhizophorae TaxID=578093 RepID=A0A6A6PA76_9PEZI|nr:hypothetical protein BDY21DRAFT_134317 [Lineolata rhizophorae]
MGRKPNQLILEFFERGPKLEDNSNRYQHTCRSCGEKFPKGRIDSLTNHLVKKCPALPMRDRQRAILQFHELPDLPEHAAAVAAANGGASTSQAMELPFAPKQPAMSGLDALAEVSRHHLDYKQRSNAPGAAGRGGKRSSNRSNAQPPPPPFTADDLLVDHDKASGAAEGAEETDRASRLTSDHAASAQFLPQDSLTESPNPQSSQAATTSMVPSPLVMAASAANELQAMMPNDNSNQSLAADADQYLHPQGRTPTGWPNNSDPAIDPALPESSKEPPETTPSKAQNYTRPIAMNPSTTQAQFLAEFVDGQRPTKPKVRGRFTDTRRKEVQEVRKRGACIRCRMLKKSCSGENPCATCKSVESARLWKQPCIRTRIADEIDLYSVGLHVVLAFHTIKAVKNQVKFEYLPGRIEASHFPDTSTFATFIMLKAHKQSGSAIDPALLENSGSMQSAMELEILDLERDDLGAKLEQYMRKLSPSFFAAEPSPFMRATLEHAQNMIENLKDSLLSRALELWVATAIITDPELSWALFSNPSSAPAMAPAILSQAELDSSGKHSTNARAQIAFTGAATDSYKLITAELQSATEKRAHDLSKMVMNDLERRLLQRTQANPFETFLVSIILLACVERMCWLFHKWEEPSSLAAAAAQASSVAPSTYDITQSAQLAAALVSSSNGDLDDSSGRNGQLQSDGSDVKLPSAPHQQASSDSPETSFQQTTTGSSLRDNNNGPPPIPLPYRVSAAKWPFDKPPRYFSQQGERFSDVVHMLLRMRNIPPKMARRYDDGALIVAPDNISANNGTGAGPNSGATGDTAGGANGNASAAAIEGDAAARAYFDAVQISADALLQGRLITVSEAQQDAWMDPGLNGNGGPGSAGSGVPGTGHRTGCREWEGRYIMKILGGGGGP